MLGHLRRRDRPQPPICPPGGDGTGRFLCRSSSKIRDTEFVVASRTRRRRARHKHHRIQGREHLEFGPHSEALSRGQIVNTPGNGGVLDRHTSAIKKGHLLR